MTVFSWPAKSVHRDKKSDQNAEFDTKMEAAFSNFI